MKVYRKDILIHRFLESAERHASEPALEINGKQWSYRELLSISSVIASKIISSGIPGPVSILASRSITAYAGILAALMSGRTYMPLNPKFPVNRNIKMIHKAGSGLMMIEGLSDYVIKEYSTAIPGLQCINPEKEDLLKVDTCYQLPDTIAGIDGEQTAYLLFTSGTTGEPKGVPVSNRNVTAYLDHMTGKYDFKVSDRFSQTFDLTFDLSVHDLFVCWLSGACLCIPENDKPFTYPKYINDHRITVWFSVPSLAVLMDKMRLLRPGYLTSLRLSFFCGEPLLVKTADKWLQAAPETRLVNLYGPSEATIAISEYEWTRIGNNKSRNGIVSIGKVFDGQEYIIEDVGDHEKYLMLAGSQVINSYLDTFDNKSGFTTIDDTRWYNTGDLVTEDADYDIFFMGRADHEIKISGYRVNLLEIDEIIREQTSHSEIASLWVKDEKPGSGALVIFIESTPGDFDEQRLLEICRNQLPWYMVPQRIIRIDQMPLNVNGKIDRKKLSELS